MTAIIECLNLSKTYGTKPALTNVNFILENNNQGATALVGPNGAGKTTLFSILANFQQATSGQVTIFGHAPGSAALLGRVSALPQDALLDPLFTIKHQLSFYARLQGYNAKQAISETQRVLELVNLGEALNERPATLSHGMRKRVAIAQALIGQPQLVMLDEPTAGLDPANARNIRTLITDLSEQAHFIISSHNLNELEQLCSTVLMLDQGALSQQLIGQTTDSSQQQLSLLLAEPATTELLTVLENLSGVSEVRVQQKNRLLIHYNANQAPRLDGQLLDCLAQHHIEYRQLTKGMSLEDQLFS